MGRASDAMVRLRDAGAGARQRSGALRRPGHHLPLLRAARRIGGGVRGRSASGSVGAAPAWPTPSTSAASSSASSKPTSAIPPYAALLARYRTRSARARCAAFTETERLAMYEGVRLVALMYRLAMEGDLEALRPKLHEVRASSFTDPEGFYLLATYLSKAGAYDEALETLDAIRPGWLHVSGRDPQRLVLGSRARPTEVRPGVDARPKPPRLARGRHSNKPAAPRRHGQRRRHETFSRPGHPIRHRGERA